ncbi:hypothetical protein PILCRDRAFT_13485 [Piloderma croceum F 1598]|uniref:Uncharacterized protein n=1 Tax=Piloderma croceum (strain F 1598) TaxID=765440 RepID=A0A0C3ESL5_PILCF|nr:hypothetical protein PILCRDRAFT_13485 [Piloderma croceum F 1598]
MAAQNRCAFGLIDTAQLWLDHLIYPGESIHAPRPLLFADSYRQSKGDERYSRYPRGIFGGPQISRHTRHPYLPYHLPRITTPQTSTTDENGVCDFYYKTTAKFCSPLVSTLALHPKAPFSRWRSLVRWTQSGVRSSYAIVDGLLRFIGKGDDEKLEAERVAVADTMGSETRLIFEKLREYLLPLGTRKMKSTCTGPLEVIIPVPNLGKFAWTSYIDEVCSTTLKDQDERKVSRTAVRPDARDPPWKLKDDSSNTSVDSADRDEAIAMPPSAPLTNPVVQRFTRSAATSGSTSSMPPPPPEISAKTVKPKIIIQQAWAQAVRVDGTIMILHSCDYELVCIKALRHSTFQTSLSRLRAQTPDTGNRMSAYRQKQLLHAMSRSKSSDDDDDSIGGDNDPGSGSGHRGGQPWR